MKQGIVIVTHESTKDFFKECWSHLVNVNYPVTIHDNTANNQFELGGIRAGYMFFDEFFLLQDTCMVKDLSLFDIVFKEYEGYSVSMCPQFFSFLGKYRSVIIRETGLIYTNTKNEAIKAEIEWNRRYIGNEPSFKCLFPTLEDGEIFEEKYGRKNMILENEYLKKYKGTWSPEMVELNNEDLWKIGKEYYILQKKAEFLKFIDFLKKNLPERKNCLEIGTNAGGTAAVFCNLFENVYSIDIEKHPLSLSLEEKYPNFHRIIGSSREWNTYSAEPYRLHYDFFNKFNLIFIDGCHFEVGDDYAQCRSLVKPGGFLVFHDILQDNEVLGQRLEVKKFWEELIPHCIRQGNKCWEITDNESFPDSIPALNALNPADWGGIGIIRINN